MHIIPQLRKLEKKYAQELVVIGVHSAKFTAEKETENIRQAVLRHNIMHPVVNDKDFRIWRSYGVRAWPTFVLIDPRGAYRWAQAGEVTFEMMDSIIADMVMEFGRELNRRPLLSKPLDELGARGHLLFPGKVLAEGSGGRIFIADTNHNRILEVALEEQGEAGRIKKIIGCGEQGLRDGDFQSAAFNQPQGMALDREALYVADTENHAIRKADLRSGMVATVAGTGEQVPLNSPWDLAIVDGVLYIAMAGCHQLWSLAPRDGNISVHAGSGREGLMDGPLRQAMLAQPSGITSDGRRLYFADSEVSAIRSADLDLDGEVRTIAGLDLFEFGDIDGVGGEVRLQHPLGVVYYEGVLYVADTYNNKIKAVDPLSRRSRTIFGTGEAGLRDGTEPFFAEPAGISAASGKLYIADTNNCAVRVADLSTGQVRTLEIGADES